MNQSCLNFAIRNVFRNFPKQNYLIKYFLKHKVGWTIGEETLKSSAIYF